MAKKPFKETKLGKFLKEKGGDLLDTVGAVATGNWIDAAGQIKDLITGSSNLTPEEKEVALKFLEQDLEAFKIEVDDRKDARNREVQIATSAEATWLNKNTGSLIALMFVVFTCTLYILVLTRQLNASENITFSVVSSVTSITTLIIGYYFGSSRSSAVKDSTISKLTK